MTMKNVSMNPWLRPALVLAIWLLGPLTGHCFFNVEGREGDRSLSAPTSLRATASAANKKPFRFSIKSKDDETALLYYGFRYYNPSTGTWLSRDPIEERGGSNLYGFVKNRPGDFFDKDGRELGYWYCPSCNAPNPPWNTSCSACGHTPEDNGMVDATMVFALGLCIPFDEVGIAVGAGWRVVGTGIRKAGQCCCRLLNKIISTKTKVDPNKLHHIFDKPQHKLHDLLQQFGGDQAQAYGAIENAVNMVKKGCGPGNFEIQVTVRGQTVTVRGTVLGDGTVTIGTVFK